MDDLKDERTELLEDDLNDLEELFEELLEETDDDVLLTEELDVEDEKEELGEEEDALPALEPGLEEDDLRERELEDLLRRLEREDVDEDLEEALEEGLGTHEQHVPPQEVSPHSPEHWRTPPKQSIHVSWQEFCSIHTPQVNPALQTFQEEELEDFLELAENAENLDEALLLAELLLGQQQHSSSRHTLAKSPGFLHEYVHPSGFSG